MIVDTGVQPGEKLQMVRSGSVRSSGASVPWSWGASPSRVDMFTHMEALRLLMGFLNGASSCRHDQVTPFPAPLPSLEKWGRYWKFQPSNHGLVSAPSRSHPEAYPGHLVRTKVSPFTQKTTRVSGALCWQGVGAGTKHVLLIINHNITLYSIFWFANHRAATFFQGSEQPG